MVNVWLLILICYIIWPRPLNRITLSIEVSLNQLRTEEAGLRDALLKMQALNEGLGQDKVDLNRIIINLEQEKATLQVCIWKLSDICLSPWPILWIVRIICWPH